MLTKMKIRNFKVFGEEIEIELGNPVVFVGPNNSGKTTALQALTLWKTGIERWIEKREHTPKEGRGVGINRLELISLPTVATKLLWNKLHVHDVSHPEGKQQTKKVYMMISVEGVTNGEKWGSPLEFYYSNDQLFWCRPVGEEKERHISDFAKEIKVAFLPPMSGLATQETRIDTGAINVRIGEGRTAEVLRNLCFLILYPNGNTSNSDEKKWSLLVDNMKRLFGIELLRPRLNTTRGEIYMTYKESSVELDLTSAGRGMQQTLLLLAFMYSNPGAIVLIDEPDAHLEIIRQQHVYSMISDIAKNNGNQIIIATHSEKILNEAADRDKVVAFVGKPHVINEGKRSEILKSLSEYGWDQYYQAEEKKWVLYLEGSTDPLILREFAKKLKHPVEKELELPFTFYVANQPKQAKSHFFALKEAVPELRAVALFDNIGNIDKCEGITWLMWERNEIENYFCFPEILKRFARSKESGNLFTTGLEEKLIKIIQDNIPPIAFRDLNNDWWKTIKASDDFLDIIFDKFYKELGIPNEMPKGQYYRLIEFLENEEMLPEMKEKLDSILQIANLAKILQ